MNEMEKPKKVISWEYLKDFVKDLDIYQMDLTPEQASLNEIASVGALLQIHAEALYAKAKVVKAKSELDKDVELFKQYQEGAWDNKGIATKSEKTKRIITSERVAKIHQDIGAGEKYAELMIIKPHQAEQADFAAAGFWQEQVLNFLKERALNFLLGILRGLIKEAIPAMVNFANTIMEQLGDRIVDLYNKGNEEEKRIFKENIKKTFPNSRLLEKLN